MIISDFAGYRYCLRNRGTNFLIFVFSCNRSYTTSHKQFKLDKCSMLLHCVVGYIPIQFITFPIIELSHLSLSKNNQVVLYSWNPLLKFLCATRKFFIKSKYLVFILNYIIGANLLRIIYYQNWFEYYNIRFFWLFIAYLWFY